MKRFTIPCDFGNQKAPFHIYIGDLPAEGKHPLQYQALWLARERGGKVPSEVMESFQKLLNIARENNVAFEDLCVYALGAAEAEKEKGSSPEPSSEK
ncbi:MAG TPA: DUF2610 domain-containing protein [Thermoanaerobaculia bacterium]|nr:DUF2610 domain-containing protein [Thermoanaerobaculia bacterium]